MKEHTNSHFLLVHGFELTLAFALLAISIVFTFAPEALNHAPIGFEERGITHHIWHYGLLGGSFLALLGLISGRPRIEMVGLILLTGAITINLLALITSGTDDQQGIAIAFRSAALVGVLIRLYLIAFYLPRVSALIREEE